MMPKHADGNMSATAFPLFSYLPEEVRVQIWVQALPGPRVIYIQRLLRSGIDPSWAWRQFDSVPFASYFTSSSPNDSIISLLRACNESRCIVKKRYSLILPHSSTWFSFPKDFLYLDWGQSTTVPYRPQHFTSSPWPDDYWADRYERPEIIEHIASQFRNLAIYNRFPQTALEEWMVTDVMGTFTGVKLLVLADRFHDNYQSGEELVWLQEEVGDERVEHGQSEQREQDRLLLRDSILWRDWSQYGKCQDLDDQRLREEWDRYRGQQDDVMPKIVRKSVTTAKLKKSLIQICCSEDNFRHIEGLDWAFVTGDHDYKGKLDLSQQISFLELALGQISSNLKYDSQGIEVEGSCLWDAFIFGLKIDKLVYKREMLELVVSEAEEMVWEEATRSNVENNIFLMDK